jgi:hypothetical protein
MTFVLPTFLDNQAIEINWHYQILLSGPKSSKLDTLVIANVKSKFAVSVSSGSICQLKLT